jgi:hypothetical protein
LSRKPSPHCPQVGLKDARKLKSFIQYIKQNKILNNTVTTKTISQERIINDTLIEFLPSALYAYKLGKNILKHCIMMLKNLKCNPSTIF